MGRKKNIVKEKNGIKYYQDIKNNRWRSYILLPDGRRKDFYGKNWKEAWEKAYNYRADLYPSYDIKKQNITLADCCNDVINLRDTGSRTESTIGTYTKRFNSIKQSELFTKNIQSININDIQDFFKKDNEKYAVNTVRKDELLVKWSFEYATHQKYIKNNIFLENRTFIDTKCGNTKKKVVRALTHEELSVFISNMEQNIDKYYPYSVMYLIMIYTGMRAGEVCALQWGDIDYKNKTININKTITQQKTSGTKLGKTTKTKNPRIISFAYFPKLENLIDIATNKKHPYSEYIFCRDNGQYLNSNYLCCEKIDGIIKKEKLNLEHTTSHQFRHTCATMLLNSGVNEEYIKNQIGHTDISMTRDVYYTYNQEDHEQDYIAQANLFRDF